MSTYGSPTGAPTPDGDDPGPSSDDVLAHADASTEDLADQNGRKPLVKTPMPQVRTTDLKKGVSTLDRRVTDIEE